MYVYVRITYVHELKIRTYFACIYKDPQIVESVYVRIWQKFEKAVYILPHGRSCRWDRTAATHSSVAAASSRFALSGAHGICAQQLYSAVWWLIEVAGACGASLCDSCIHMDSETRKIAGKDVAEFIQATHTQASKARHLKVIISPCDFADPLVTLLRCICT